MFCGHHDDGCDINLVIVPDVVAPDENRHADLHLSQKLHSNPFGCARSRNVTTEERARRRSFAASYGALSVPRVPKTPSREGRGVNHLGARLGIPRDLCTDIYS